MQGKNWRGMSNYPAKRFKCEYSVLCEKHTNTQWKLTVDAEHISTHPHQVVIFSETSSGAACRAIAEALHVDSSSIETQIHISPRDDNVLPVPTLVSNLHDMLCREVPLPYPPCAGAFSTHTADILSVGYDFVQALAQRVFETLGPGYSETIYHKALAQELSMSCIPHEMERVIPVTYRNMQIGVVRADIVVQAKMVVELKAVAKITPAHLQQAQRYGTLLSLSEVMVINFPVVATANIEVHVLRETWQNVTSGV